MFSQTDNAVFSGLLVGLAGVITAGRLYIRIGQLRRVEWTDSWNLIALVFLIALVAIENAYFPYASQTSEWYEGSKARPPDHVVISGYKLQLAETFMITSTLTAVKISLLLFYRSIFGSSRTFQRLCWVVLGAVMINFFISTLSMFWTCGDPADLFSIDVCVTPSAWSTRRSIYIISCVFTLFTSLCIIILPTYMLRKLDISIGQKIGLAAIFALAAGDITLEIPRTVYAINGASLTLLLIWNILQGCIAVIVCGLPTYRGIFAMTASERGTDIASDTGDYYDESGRPEMARRRDSVDNYGYGSESTYGYKSTAPTTPANGKPPMQGCISGHPYPYPFKCVIEGAPLETPWIPPGDETGVELDGGDLFGSVSKAEKKRRPFCAHCPREWYDTSGSSSDSLDGLKYGISAAKAAAIEEPEIKKKKPKEPPKAYVAGSWEDWAQQQRPPRQRWTSQSSVKKSQNQPLSRSNSNSRIAPEAPLPVAAPTPKAVQAQALVQSLSRNGSLNRSHAQAQAQDQSQGGHSRNDSGWGGSGGSGGGRTSFDRDGNAVVTAARGVRDGNGSVARAAGNGAVAKPVERGRVAGGDGGAGAGGAGRRRSAERTAYGLALTTGERL